jgi:hypothetical protein
VAGSLLVPESEFFEIMPWPTVSSRSLPYHQSGRIAPWTACGRLSERFLQAEARKRRLTPPAASSSSSWIVQELVRRPATHRT